MKLGAPHWMAPSAAAGLLALSLAVSFSPALAASPASPSAGQAAAGETVFQHVCGNCHDIGVSTGQKKSRDEWQATVSRMVANGAPLSEEQVAQVVDYLAKAYGAD